MIQQYQGYEIVIKPPQIIQSNTVYFWSVSKKSELIEDGWRNKEKDALFCALNVCDSDISEFELKDYHLQLLQSSYIKFFQSAYGYGAIAIDDKRPFGNSAVLVDILDCLNLLPANTEELTPELEFTALTIYRECAIALQICLNNLSFKTGKYFRPNPLETRNWLFKN